MAECTCCQACADRIQYLEDQLGLVRDINELDQIRQAFSLRGLNPASLLITLYRRNGRVVRHDELDDILPTDRNRTNSLTLKVMICQLRSRLGKSSIESIYGGGYRLTRSGLATVRAALQQNLDTTSSL